MPNNDSISGLFCVGGAVDGGTVAPEFGGFIPKSNDPGCVVSCCVVPVALFVPPTGPTFVPGSDVRCSCSFPFVGLSDIFFGVLSS